LTFLAAFLHFIRYCLSWSNFWVCQIHCSYLIYAQIIFLAGFVSQGVSIRVLTMARGSNFCREKGLLLSFGYKFGLWHAGAVSFPLIDIIWAELACTLSDVMFYLHSVITNLSLYKHYDGVRWLPEYVIFEFDELRNLANSRSRMRKEFLSRINWIYYWRAFCTTHEHCNYLQLIKMEAYTQMIIKRGTNVCREIG
jgi:hypothetical protein